MRGTAQQGAVWNKNIISSLGRKKNIKQDVSETGAELTRSK